MKFSNKLEGQKVSPLLFCKPYLDYFPFSSSFSSFIEKTDEPAVESLLIVEQQRVRVRLLNRSEGSEGRRQLISRQNVLSQDRLGRPGQSGTNLVDGVDG